MKIPTIHLNGTSGDVLREQWQAAYKAVCDAITALCEATPNGRDYYVQGEEAALTAQREHNQRLFALRAVKAEIYDIVEGIDLQLDAREAQRSGK